MLQVVNDDKCFFFKFFSQQAAIKDPLGKLNKGPVKLNQHVKIAHSFLHVMSKLFHSIIFSLSR